MLARCARHRASHRAYPGGHFVPIKWVNTNHLWYKTIDYVVLLSGRVTLLLDEDERDLEPFDVVVQQGTNHAWINKTTEPALLCAILIDAEVR